MKCWYCGSEAMEDAPELGKGWKRCLRCGATWIEFRKSKKKKVKSG